MEVNQVIGSVFVVILAVFLVVVALAWLVLPLVIISRLRKLTEAVDRSNLILNVIANHTREKPVFNAEDAKMFAEDQ